MENFKYIFMFMLTCIIIIIERLNVHNLENYIKYFIQNIKKVFLDANVIIYKY